LLATRFHIRGIVGDHRHLGDLIVTGGHAARQAQCKNKLKQIGLATHNYEGAKGKVPPACFWDETVTWLVLIQPFLEQQAAFDRWTITDRWHRRFNVRAQRQSISDYLCPSRSRPTELTPAGNF